MSIYLNPELERPTTVSDTSNPLPAHKLLKGKKMRQKISELILELVKHLGEHGDIDIAIQDEPGAVEGKTSYSDIIAFEEKGKIVLLNSRYYQP